jgi:cytochrome b
MKSVFIYDLPTRIFHWSFAGLFLTSFFIGKTIDDEELLFSYHMLSGMVLTFIILLRVIWGIWGSEHAKFQNFDLNPLNLKNYFLGLIANSRERWAGHNPASSWAALIMMGLGLSLGATGFFMVTGWKEQLEDFHEVAAHVFMIIVVIHIMGIIIHTIRHKDWIGLSMVTGNKILPSETSGITKSHFAVSIVFLGLAVGFASYLNANFDVTKRTLNLFGQTLELGSLEEDYKNSNPSNKTTESYEFNKTRETDETQETQETDESEEDEETD